MVNPRQKDHRTVKIAFVLIELNQIDSFWYF